MDSETFSLTFLLCISLFSYFHPATSKTIPNDPFPYESLIKAFNLSSNHDAPRLVERTFHHPTAFSGGGVGPSLEEFSHHARVYRLPHARAGWLFYFFFESRNSRNDPVLISLNGGPDSSSSVGLFYENGPISNIIYIDQPVGTGFSYTSDPSDLRHDQNGVSPDLYDFLQAFFRDRHHLARNDFYITGQSSAGHYIPALASRIHHGNKNRERIYINLKGFTIGNGLTNHEMQYEARADYAYFKKLISLEDYKNFKQNLFPVCQRAIRLCNAYGGGHCIYGHHTCDKFYNTILAHAGNINQFDVRKPHDSYDFSNLDKFFSQQQVKTAIGVTNLKFAWWNQEVFEALRVDALRNYDVGIPALLEDGIKFLAYAGEFDLSCNWIGITKWVAAMQWSGKTVFNKSPTVPFMVEGTEAGTIKNYGPLTLLKVKDAGHYVPMDQPKAALHMMYAWIHGRLGTTSNKIGPI